MTDKNPKTVVKLSDLEMEVLLQVLAFANTAALVVQNLEIERKSDPKDIQKMAGVASDAKELIRIITTQTTKPEEKPTLLH